jgi:hypothetical protein
MNHAGAIAASKKAPTEATPVPIKGHAEPLERLRAFLDTHRMKEKMGPGAFADFERELQARMLELQRDVIASEMKRLDIDVPAVVIEGRVHRRVLRQSHSYMTSAGEVVVERTLYKDRAEEEGRAVSPMELTIGVVGDFWTPRAAQQALWVVAQMTPKKSVELFERVGNMDPSQSSLGRLPKVIAERWEQDRASLEGKLREGLAIPDGTVSIAVSLDGVLAPMEDTEVTRRRIDAAAEGRITKGPLGYREVGCGTISFCDAKGDLLGAIRLARAPESKKVTLKEMLATELSAILRDRPELVLVKLADGAADNWEFLSGKLPAGEEALDFFHASEHLHAAIAAAYGDGTRETQYRYETLRDALRDEEGGADKVIRALKHLTTKHPRRDKIRHALQYFRGHKTRMQYAALKQRGLPIGSGVVEAACKTLVTQRLKNSGMRWSTVGAQAILTPRGWDQSDRFDEAWALVAATFHTEVTVLANVVAFKPVAKSRKAMSR